MTAAGDVTALLLAWSDGDEAAHSRLVDAVYDELRRMAKRHLRRERSDHSLAPTALVHEAYLKLVDQRRVHWHNRTHFFAVAGHMMRRILVDHARSRGAAKRGGPKVALDGIDPGMPAFDVELLALDGALEKLAALDERQSRLVELRFFAGLSVDEAAAAMGIAPITVKRDWALTRAWLFRELRSLTP